MISREDQENQAAHEDQSGHETHIQSVGGAVIAPNDPDLIGFSKNQCPLI